MKRLIMVALVLAGCTTQKNRRGDAPPEPLLSAIPPITSVPFTLHDNRMLVDVFLNGQGPFVMIFDPGGIDTITPETQCTLDLKSQGPELDASPREKVVNSVHLKSFQLGDYKANDLKFAVVNLNTIRKTFRFPHLDGIVGGELIQQSKVRLDFDSQRIQMLPSESPLPNAAIALKFELVGAKPLIMGKINDQPAKILIDTGDRSNLTLFRKFAASSQLEKLFLNRDEVLTGMGTAGPIRGKVASVQKVELGSHEVTDILARLPMTQKGYFYSDTISASAGLGLLKGFNIELDYKNHLLALQPRRDFKDSSTFVPVKTGRL